MCFAGGRLSWQGFENNALQRAAFEERHLLQQSFPKRLSDELRFAECLFYGRVLQRAQSMRCTLPDVFCDRIPSPSMNYILQDDVFTTEHSVVSFFYRKIVYCIKVICKLDINFCLGLSKSSQQSPSFKKFKQSSL